MQSSLTVTLISSVSAPPPPPPHLSPSLWVSSLSWQNIVTHREYFSTPTSVQSSHPPPLPTATPLSTLQSLCVLFLSQFNSESQILHSPLQYFPPPVLCHLTQRQTWWAGPKPEVAASSPLLSKEALCHASPTELGLLKRFHQLTVEHQNSVPLPPFRYQFFYCDLWSSV